jgi:hypothetical protein
MSDRMDTLASVLEVAEFYEERVRQANAQTAEDAMRVLAKEIEADGLYGTKASREMEAP